MGCSAPRPAVGVSFTKNTEKYYFAKVSKDIFQIPWLTSGAITVYSYLSGLVSPESPYPWPSYQKIAEASHMSRRTAIEKIKELLNAGLLEKRATFSKDYRQQRSNVYHVLPVPDTEVARKNKVIARCELERYRNQLLKKSTRYVTERINGGKPDKFREMNHLLGEYFKTAIREQIRKTPLLFLKEGGGEKSAPYIDLPENTELNKNTDKKEKYPSNLVTWNSQIGLHTPKIIFVLWMLPEGRAGP